MKTVILGDIHLGAGLSFGKLDLETGLNTRLLDYKTTLESVCSYVHNNQIDTFIILGDVFDTRNPSPLQLSIFYTVIKELSERKIETIIIMGNHDYIKAKDIYSSLEPIKAINLPYIKVYDRISLYEKEDYNLILLPYQNRNSLDSDSTKSAVEEVKNEIRRLRDKGNPKKPTILCGHMMVEGTVFQNSDLGVKELVLPIEAFEGISLSIMGHIHVPMNLSSSPPIIYCGSMECNKFIEKDAEKRFLEIDCHAEPDQIVKSVPIPTRKFVDLELTYENVNKDTIMKEIFDELAGQQTAEAVVRVSIKVNDQCVSLIDTEAIKNYLVGQNAFYISDINVFSISSRQVRNKEITESLDHLSAFKKYLESQTNVLPGVLSAAEEIINRMEKPE